MNVTEQLLVYFEDTYIDRFCVDAPTCSIGLMQNFHKPVMAWKTGNSASKNIYHHITLVLQDFTGVKE